jgi:hypothetical protein
MIFFLHNLQITTGLSRLFQYTILSCSYCLVTASSKWDSLYYFCTGWLPSCQLGNCYALSFMVPCTTGLITLRERLFSLQLVRKIAANPYNSHCWFHVQQGSWPQFSLSWLWESFIYYRLGLGKLLLAFASTVILGSGYCGIHYHIFLPYSSGYTTTQLSHFHSNKLMQIVSQYSYFWFRVLWDLIIFFYLATLEDK